MGVVSKLGLRGERLLVREMDQVGPHCNSVIGKPQTFARGARAERWGDVKGFSMLFAHSFVQILKICQVVTKSVGFESKGWRKK